MVWTGIMAFTNDTYPYVGKLKNYQNSFIISAFNGHGMPVIWKSSMELIKLIFNESNEIPFQFNSER